MMPSTKHQIHIIPTSYILPPPSLKSPNPQHINVNRSLAYITSQDSSAEWHNHPYKIKDKPSSEISPNSCFVLLRVFVLQVLHSGVLIGESVCCLCCLYPFSSWNIWLGSTNTPRSWVFSPDNACTGSGHTPMFELMNGGWCWQSYLLTTIMGHLDALYGVQLLGKKAVHMSSDKV